MNLHIAGNLSRLFIRHCSSSSKTQRVSPTILLIFALCLILSSGCAKLALQPDSKGPEFRFKNVEKLKETTRELEKEARFSTDAFVRIIPQTIVLPRIEGLADIHETQDYHIHVYASLTQDIKIRNRRYRYKIKKDNSSQQHSR